MRHNAVKVGMDITHRLPGGTPGKRLGVVTAVGPTAIRYADDNGNPGVATAAEIIPTPKSAE